MSIKNPGSVEVEAGKHKIQYKILDNFTTSRGTDFKFSTIEEGIKEMYFEGGYWYLLGTAGRSRDVQIIYKDSL